MIGGGGWKYFDAKLGFDADSFGVFLVVIGGGEAHHRTEYGSKARQV